jgi:hypothetical protein
LANQIWASAKLPHGSFGGGFEVIEKVDKLLVMEENPFAHMVPFQLGLHGLEDCYIAI